jgi:cytochrome c biogenesis protein CcmG/thiol:disulfide interchange protein DsbE
MRAVRLRRPILVVAAGVALLATACGEGGSPGGGAEGSLLPRDPAALPAFDLASYRQLLEELRGRPVLVNFWASWCGPCREEGPHLAAAHAEYGERVQFLGVDILDSRESARAFMREMGWTYPSVFDATGAIRDGLGLIGQPVTLFYDAAGELVDTWTGQIGQAELVGRLERLAAG